MTALRVCQARYEPAAPAWGTHTCGRLDGHSPPHVCPDCLRQWDRPGAPLRTRRARRSPFLDGRVPTDRE